jgi:hypothetical protein
MRANGLTKSLWASYYAKAMSCPSVNGEGSREGKVAHLRTLEKHQQQFKKLNLVSVAQKPHCD